jgi:NAD(P)-dependent dehydrogenase (short-subunit alcohol dehydrogenase family)
MNRLAERIVMVTGGARGVGRAIAAKCLAEGATVALVDRDAASGETAAQALAAGAPAMARPHPEAPATTRVTFLHADVTRESDVEGAVRAILDRHGRIDVLVNNAGVNAYFDAVAMTEAQWDAVFAVDLKGAWLCAKHVLPGMRARRAGSIVNIASIHAGLTIAGMFPYAAAKSGLVGLTRSLALDCARDGIRVNAVSPGWTRTQLIEEWFRLQPDPAGAEAGIMRVHPMGRIATPEEIASVVAFVASDEASAMTGAEVAVDCGLRVQFAT